MRCSVHQGDIKKILSVERTPDITNYFLVPFRVRYIGILLYIETRLTLYNVCLVHRGVLSASGDTMSTSGDVQYMGDIMSTLGDIMMHVGEQGDKSLSIYIKNSDVLMISPTCIMISPDVLMVFTHMHNDIPWMY